MTARPSRTSPRRRALLAATEPARTLATAGSMAALPPLLRWAPRGEPHPVLVLPGLMASDSSTRVLRTWLGRLGYPVVGWALGRNRGPTKEVVDELPLLLDRLAAEHRTAVSIVGWSLGGIYARRLAKRVPGQVRQVISLGSPFAMSGRRADDSPGARVYRQLAPVSLAERRHTTGGSLARPLPVPSTAVYSRWDGVVDWRARPPPPRPRSENAAVHSRHPGIGPHPAPPWGGAPPPAPPPAPREAAAAAPP